MESRRLCDSDGIREGAKAGMWLGMWWNKGDRVSDVISNKKEVMGFLYPTNKWPWVSIPVIRLYVFYDREKGFHTQ